ncbi:uncharacterized protein TOT_020000217 [Theileria orientalis strain Shintoku]|uniref:Uncharacterized protein n=1 Tax=Theileria orientalis strain Shintoku TaxID=869250 RepID=J4C374_THEOR|nr:uncharacterized protein TOT_020000217 [Theileria orientalis strain Shintoku]BAM39946.1 uncharacterized protein TOT_020000217 [Theileria orientalis strain Shintoku]|eukprot:XP_009690247.1 uncharacterized protein TOT_020000217 [Theileria orientalis strain Shintoku]
MDYISKIRNIARLTSIVLPNQGRFIRSKSIAIEPKIHVNYAKNKWKRCVECVDKRYYVTSGNQIKLEDDYYIKEAESNFWLLGVTKSKFKDFNEIVYINFTEETELKRGDYLFSVEDSKTLYDFYSPLDCTIEEVNPKFANQTTEEVLKDLFDNPEGDKNYLVKVKKKSS